MKKRKFGVRAKLLAFILPVVALALFALIMIANVYSRNMLEQKRPDYWKQRLEEGLIPYMHGIMM